jgi:CBS domain-containing protein
MANIGEICKRDVVCASRDTTVAGAAKLLRHHHVGSLIVVEPMNGDGRMPVGVVTDRDIVIEVTAVDLDPKVITVGDIMAPELITAPDNLGIIETMEVMRLKGVRRLPIVDRGGLLVGIVSTDDMLEVLAEELTDVTRIVAREQAREMQGRK